MQEASAVIRGDGAFGRLNFEAGVHRVQRVPATESSGRLHTSAMSIQTLLIGISFIFGIIVRWCFWFQLIPIFS